MILHNKIILNTIATKIEHCNSYIESFFYYSNHPAIALGDFNGKFYLDELTIGSSQIKNYSADILTNLQYEIKL